MKRLLLSTFSFILFMSVIHSQVTTVGLIGEATPIGDWDTDVDMIQDATDTSLWTLTVTLADGPVKFRANDDWAQNWGNPNPEDFMHGIGEQDLDNMQAFAGEYNITFNHVSGEYSFEYISDIGMIGPATPNANWDDDVNMYRDQNDPNKFFSWLNLSADDVKFRKDDDWAVNWGASDFPSGTAILGDPGNIPVSPAGFYQVLLDTLSGEYTFNSETFFDTLGIIGEGTSNMNWDDDIYLTQDANNGHVWTGVVELVGGGIKFRANSDWATNWGGTEWPSGTAILGSGDNLPSEAGNYYVLFNSDSGDFSFTELGSYGSIGLIGPATPNGWAGPDVDMVQDPNDEAIWTLRTDLLEGELKFRADDDWANSWGAADFPEGTGELNGTINIPVSPAGDYIITFNSITGYYNFQAVVEYDEIGIIGKSTEFANWDDDVILTKNPADFNSWTLESITLTEWTGEDDSGIKFRANRDWGVNWGPTEADVETAFPGGLGVQDGKNIRCPAGTFSVSFNSATAEYVFGEPSKTEDILHPSAINIFPNPTQDYLNIDLKSAEITGEVQIEITDFNGKMVMSKKINIAHLTDISVSNLNSGNYFISIRNQDYLIGKKFTIVK